MVDGEVRDGVAGALEVALAPAHVVQARLHEPADGGARVVGVQHPVGRLGDQSPVDQVRRRRPDRVLRPPEPARQLVDADGGAAEYSSVEPLGIAIDVQGAEERGHRTCSGRVLQILLGRLVPLAEKRHPSTLRCDILGTTRTNNTRCD